MTLPTVPVGQAPGLIPRQGDPAALDRPLPRLLALLLAVLLLLGVSAIPANAQTTSHARVDQGEELVFVLGADGMTGLGEAVDLVSVNPARCLGLPDPTISVGQPLTAALGVWGGHTFVGQSLWCDGRRTFSRIPERG